MFAINFAPLSLPLLEIEIFGNTLHEFSVMCVRVSDGLGIVGGYFIRDGFLVIELGVPPFKSC